MMIRYRFKSKEARRHVARRMQEAWADGRSYANLALNRWHFAEGYPAESIADAISGGPHGGEWEDVKE